MQINYMSLINTYKSEFHGVGIQEITSPSNDEFHNKRT
jgi:hypothetical protein